MKFFLLYLISLALGTILGAKNPTGKCENIMCTLLSLKPSNCLTHALNYCTHIFYQPREYDVMAIVTDLKSQGVKVIMTVSSNQYPEIASSLVFTERFIDDALHTARKHAFDGIFIMWTWPLPEQSELYHNFLRNVMAGLKREADTSEKPRLLLFHVLGPGYILNSYYLNDTYRFVDYSVLINSGWSGPWNKVTGINSPFHQMKEDIHYIIESKHPSNKLITYLPIHGRSFELANDVPPKVGSPVYGDGYSPLKHLRHKSGEAYYETCALLKDPKVQLAGDDQSGPYLYLDRYWLSYENQETMYAKTNLAIENKLGGVFLSALEDDDCDARCPDPVEMPMLRRVHHTCNKG